MEIKIEYNPESAYHPGIDIDGRIKPGDKKYTVWEQDESKPRYQTDYDHELLVQNRKKPGAPIRICTVEHFLQNQDRDRLVPVKKLYPQMMRETGWKKKAQMVVDIPDGFYKDDSAPIQAQEIKHAGRPARKE